MLQKLRVHIVPVGYEADRIIEPIIKNKADKVYFVTHTKGQDEAEENVENALKEVKKQGISDVKVIHCNISDVYDILRNINRVLDQEKGNLIYINLSTGNKRATIAGMMSAMMSKEDVTPYYAETEQYGQSSKSPKVLSQGVKGIQEIPTFKILLPEPELIEALKFIAEKERRKRDIVRYAQENLLEPEELCTKNINVKVNRRIIDKLEYDWKLIKVEGNRKAATVSINENGRMMLKVFE
ncbi:hypothetical protein GF345_03770 [Candidatus Woesearchaeota archaeon]|nr:hypothetical protein [Candidatus Woesearchaeota archaeon]